MQLFNLIFGLNRKKKKNIEVEEVNPIIIIGNSASGKVREIYTPMNMTGEDILNTLLIRGEYAGYNSHFTDGEIYIALSKCKRLLNVPSVCFAEKNEKSLSSRQSFCSNAAIKLIMENRYNQALHEFEDCIDDYGKGRSRLITISECVLYNCVLNCFIARLEENTENLKTAKSVTEKVIEIEEAEIMRMEECAIIKKAVENGLPAPLQFDGKCEGFESDGREVPVLWLC